MQTIIGSRGLRFGMVAAAALLLPTFLWPDFWAKTLSAQGFLPHSYCFTWQPGVIWLNAGSDVTIGLSYLAISGTLAVLVNKTRREIPFSWMFLAFGAFIVACGLTHLMEVWTLWEPRYWLAGELKLITAVASVATAVALPPLVPRVLALVRDAKLSRERKQQLESANDELGRLNARLRELDELKTQALQESERRWRAVFESSAIGIVLTDVTERVLAANPAFKGMLGYTEEEFRELSLTELTAEDERDASRLRVAQLLDGGLQEYHVQKRYRRKNGSFAWTNTSVSLIPATGGTPTLLVRVVEDITERKGAEEALAEVQTNLERVTRATAMGELAASIAHEVNQPLAAVVANGHACARWLAAKPPNLPEANEAVQRIVRDANRASEIVSRIRTFLKRGAPHRTELDLGEVVREVIGMVQGEARARDVSLRVEAAAGLPSVVADRVALQQVILNLVMNAIEAMSAVGERDRVVEIGADKHGADALRVAVRDSGVGLDPKRRNRIFDAFYTTKPEGMGMGLAISRSIVEAHGGRLWATANEIAGETFQFTLPLAARPAA
jgi:PAS domain S-box-containing protein